MMMIEMMMMMMVMMVVVVVHSRMTRTGRFCRMVGIADSCATLPTSDTHKQHRYSREGNSHM